MAQTLAAFDYWIEHRIGKSVGHAGCLSRLPATTAALNMTATTDVDASVAGQLNPSSHFFPAFNSQSPPAEPSHGTTIPWDNVKSNHVDREQSGVKHGHEAGVNKNKKADKKPAGIINGHEVGANKPISQFTVFDQQGVLLEFSFSKAHCRSTDFKLGAGLLKQIKEKFPSCFPTKKDYKQQVLHAQYLGNDKLVIPLVVKPRFFHKPSHRP